MLESLDERLCLHMKAAGWRVVPLFTWRETNKQGIQLMNVNRDSEEKVTYIFFSFLNVTKTSPSHLNFQQSWCHWESTPDTWLIWTNFLPVDVTHLKDTFPCAPINFQKILCSVFSVYNHMYGDVHWLLHCCQLTFDGIQKNTSIKMFGVNEATYLSSSTTINDFRSLETYWEEWITPVLLAFLVKLSWEMLQWCTEDWWVFCWLDQWFDEAFLINYCHRSKSR